MSVPTKPAQCVVPPYFGNEAHADNRRWEFNFKNEILVTNQTPVDIAFIGDSITHNWEVNAYFNHFGRVINRGISGDRAPMLAQRFEGDSLQFRPRVCVAMFGINNTWCLDGTTSTEAQDEVLALVASSYRQMMEQAKAYHVPLLFCSVLPVSDTSEIGQRRNQVVLRMNAALKNLCEEFGVTYVDYHSAMVAEDGVTLRSDLSDDTLHPHVIGYNCMAAVLTPLLEQVLNQTKANDAKG